MGIVGILHASITHQLVAVVSDVLGNESVEETAQGIVHKLHRVHLASMHQVGSHLPNHVAKLGLQLLSTRVDIDIFCHKILVNKINLILCI